MNQTGAGEQRQSLWNPDPAAQLLRQFFRVAMHRGRTESLTVPKSQGSKRRSAQAVRLLQDRVEHRREIAGRGIDNLQDLRGRRLLLQRLVTLCSAFGKLTLQIGYELFRIGERAVGYRAHFCGPRRDRL